MPEFLLKSPASSPQDYGCQQNCTSNRTYYNIGAAGTCGIKIKILLFPSTFYISFPPFLSSAVSFLCPFLITVSIQTKLWSFLYCSFISSSFLHFHQNQCVPFSTSFCPPPFYGFISPFLLIHILPSFLLSSSFPPNSFSFYHPFYFTFFSPSYSSSRFLKHSLHFSPCAPPNPRTISCLIQFYSGQTPWFFSHILTWLVCWFLLLWFTVLLSQP